MSNANDQNRAEVVAWKTVAFVLAGLLAISVLGNSTVVSGMMEAKGAQTVELSPSTQPERRPRLEALGAAIANIGPDDDPQIGSESAGVEVIAFLDFECHFCARFYADIYGQIYENYIATGMVRFVTRDLVLRKHARGMAAAKAAGCVKRLSNDHTFYEYQGALYESGDLSDQSLRLRAHERGINANLFEDCIEDNNGVIAAEIASDVSDARVAGVRGTPTVFVNGRMIAGAQSYEVYRLAIDGALGR